MHRPYKETMTRYDPKRHHRRSIRLRGYDYGQPGAYFVTIVTHGRELLFEDPLYRSVVETNWRRIPQRSPTVELDEWVVMPNHLHGILLIAAQPDAAARAGEAPHPPKTEPLVKSPPSGSLGAIVGTFKSVAARRINRLRKMPGTPVWQRNYHERVIRNERELNAIRQYIRDNPANWAGDRDNPIHYL